MMSQLDEYILTSEQHNKLASLYADKVVNKMSRVDMEQIIYEQICTDSESQSTHQLLDAIGEDLGDNMVTEFVNNVLSDKSLINDLNHPGGKY
tara:strand:- start:1376 stop:1654 length:279 start_codon:yes stop_codon:yes gene_type:complete